MGHYVRVCQPTKAVWMHKTRVYARLTAASRGLETSMLCSWAAACFQHAHLTVFVLFMHIAGSSVVCTDAITLTNTGKVRLDVDDVVINSTIGILPARCKLNSMAVNLTAVNATLMPGDQLLCSFTAVPPQAAYEAGGVLFNVKAVGVAAYGTHPSITGVNNGVVSGLALWLARGHGSCIGMGSYRSLFTTAGVLVPGPLTKLSCCICVTQVSANPANITFNQVSNVTVQSSVIGSVMQIGEANPFVLQLKY